MLQRVVKTKFRAATDHVWFPEASKNETQACSLGDLKQPTLWALHWQKYLCALQDSETSETLKELVLKQALRVFAHLNEYCKKCVEQKAVVPPPQVGDRPADDPLDSETDHDLWAAQLSQHEYLLFGLFDVWNLWKEQMPETIFEAALCFRDLALGPFLRASFKSWFASRDDQIVGTLRDGYWSSEIRAKVIRILATGARLWNRVFLADESPYFETFSSFCDKESIASCAEFLNSMFDARPTAEADARERTLENFFAASEGLPLLALEPSAPLAARKIEDAAAHAASNTYKISKNLVHPTRRPWNQKIDAPQRELPFSEMSLGALFLYCEKLWRYQHEILWLPTLEMQTTWVILDCLGKYNLMDAETRKTELFAKRFGTRLMVWRTVGVSKTIEIDPVAGWCTFERWSLHWSKLLWMRSEMCRAAQLFVNLDTFSFFEKHDEDGGARAAAEKEAWILSKTECQSWEMRLLRQIVAIRRLNSGRDIFKEAFSQIASGYLLLPADLENYIENNDAIKARKPKDVLAQTRPTEFNEIITLVFNALAPVHTVLHGAQSGAEMMDEYLQLLKASGGGDANPLSVSPDPIVDSSLKTSVYHRMLPVVFKELLRHDAMQRATGADVSLTELEEEMTKLAISEYQLVRQHESVVSNEKNYESSKLQLSEKKKRELEIEGEPKKLSARSEARLNSISAKISDAQAAQTRVLEKIAEAHRRYLLQKGKKGSLSKTSFEDQFFVPHYGLRCYGSVESLERLEHIKELRNGAEPFGFHQVFFFNSERKFSVDLSEKPVWIVFVRGEYWVWSSRKVFGRTRSLAAALKFFYVELRAVTPENQVLPDSAFDPVSRQMYR